MLIEDPAAVVAARIAAAGVGGVGNGAPYVTEDGRLRIPYDSTEGMRAFLHEVHRLSMVVETPGAAELERVVFKRLGLVVGGRIVLRGDTAKPYLGHVDWWAVHRTFWALDAWRDAPEAGWGAPPKFRVRWGTIPKQGFVSGHAWYRRRCMVITISPNAEIADVYGTILHEQAHLRGHHGHNSAFRTALNAAAMEALLIPGVDPAGDWSQQWEFDRALVEQIRLNRGLDDTALVLARSVAEAQEVKDNEMRTRPSRADRLAAIVARRYERAQATLAVHEAKLRREQLLVRKWKAKVNGYERRAAAKRAPRDGEEP
jgi:hypothetical protein